MQRIALDEVSDLAWNTARRLSGPLKRVVPVEVKYFAHFLRRFGPVAGPRLFRQVYHSPRNEVVRLDVPGVPAPLFLRAQTSDAVTFLQVFVAHDYRMPALPNARLVIDAGANIGMATVWFATKYPAAKVVAIEPDDGNFELLRRNTASYKNVVLLRKGLWHRATRLAITNPTDAPWSFEVDERPDGSIDATTLGDVARDLGLPKADIIKLDIEGSEREVLSSPPAWINDVDVIFCELHERKRPGCEAALDRVAQAGSFQRKIAGEKQVLVRALSGPAA